MSLTSVYLSTNVSKAYPELNLRRWNILAWFKQIIITLPDTFIQIGEFIHMMKERSDYKRRVDRDDIPVRFMLFNKLPCFSFCECFASGIHKMRIRVAYTFFPGCGIVVLFLTIRKARISYTL